MMIQLWQTMISLFMLHLFGDINVQHKGLVLCCYNNRETKCVNNKIKMRLSTWTGHKVTDWPMHTMTNRL